MMGTYVRNLHNLVEKQFYWVVYAGGSSPGAGRLLQFKRQRDSVHLRFLDTLSGIVKTYVQDRVSAVYVWETALPAEDLD